MSVRNLQERYLFHDKKIYALVVSALHIKGVLSVFFHSFLAETRKVPRAFRTGGTWGTAELDKDSSTRRGHTFVPRTASLLPVSGDLSALRELP